MYLPECPIAAGAINGDSMKQHSCCKLSQEEKKKKCINSN